MSHVLLPARPGSDRSRGPEAPRRRHDRGAQPRWRRRGPVRAGCDLAYLRRGATAAVRSPRPPNNTSIPALRRRNDPVAVAALVSGLLALGPIAMLLGVWGRRRVHARPARGGYALASIGLWLGLAASLVYLWMLLESGGAGSV